MSGAVVDTLSVGGLAPLELPRGRPVQSGIRKRPTDARLHAGPEGFAVDAQGDRTKHGGPDKALCVFPREHYAWFEAQAGRALAVPAFGENLTTRGLTEHEVCIGDAWLVGDARCEVSLPRNPCFRPAALHGLRAWPLWMERSGFTGFYLRVLSPGTVWAGAPLTLLARPYPVATVAEANRVMHHDRRDASAIRRLLAVPALGASWRRTFTARLAGSLEDPSPRRFGPPPSPPGDPA